MPYSVLLVDPDDALFQRVLDVAERQRLDWHVLRATSVAQARGLLQQQAFEVVALRHRLPDGTAFDLRRAAGGAALLIGVEPGQEVVGLRALRQGFVGSWVHDAAGRFALTLPTRIMRIAQRRQQDSQRNTVNARLASQNRVLQSISQAQAAFMAAPTQPLAFDRLLSSFMSLSHSAYGFLGEVVAEGEGAPRLRCQAIADTRSDNEERARLADRLESGTVFADLDRLLEAGTDKGRAVALNVSPEQHGPLGLPPGHPPLEAFLGLPVRAAGRVVAFVGLANRPGGYAQQQIELLEPLVSTVAQLSLVSRTIAERMSTEKRLRESEARWRDLTALSYGWYWETDSELRLARTEGMVGQSEGYLPNPLQLGMHPWEMETLNLNENHWRAHRKLLESHQEFHDFELELRNDGGDSQWMSISGRPVFDEGVFRGYRGVGRDISARKHAEARVEWLAFIDDLTGLPNRRLLLDRLEQALGDSTRLGRCGALLLLDLDNFKDANDTLGPAGGDRLLTQVASRLRGCVRPHDTVARFGGDEFVVLVQGLPSDIAAASAQAEALAQAVLATLGRAYSIDDGDVVSTPSIGIAVFADHQLLAHELIKRADLAMYEAKAAGRNTYCFFDPSMQEGALVRMRLESDLRQALARQLLLVYYQPVVDRKGRMSGVEALVRWPRPPGGMVSPAEFIPVAERTGLIVTLGRQVLCMACRQLAVWAGDPRRAHLTISVNVSAREFRHPQFVSQMLSVVEQEGANPRLLKLEITESLLLHDVQDTIAKMAALRSHGLALSLDDFGTGYSSLSYLKKLPFDQLKIDQSFVRGVLVDPHDAAVACTIIQLARSFGLTVVAEGVETEGQREYLMANGCELFQGYLFGRPVPVDQLPES
ncbi:EAL domain-containing protein [Xylophilus rhododendri]|uniref:EAL domain-containing protein n=1 Tax=Xylophilus rhododendri TaxID=2697032 RepID=A0A857J4D5_9BURK|nr:EAL domain-containing protein [Xylophilus rhododendri]QHI98820.1 EAL domain-containing protein [Xylophilus rhododendri]